MLAILKMPFLSCKIYAEGKSNLSDHAIKEDQEIKPTEETMIITHFKNDQRTVNIL